jgi:phosphohistidine phosphatase
LGNPLPAASFSPGLQRYSLDAFGTNPLPFTKLLCVKSLLLVRHAKSSWSNTNLADFDRPLNDRGNRDAPTMAKRLMAKGISIDLYLTSPAKRALQTAQHFLATMKAEKHQLKLAPELYQAEMADFYAAINGQANHHSVVAIFSHNPGITQMAGSLGIANIDDMPTCAIFGVHALCNDWAKFEAAEKRYWMFDYPKL